MITALVLAAGMSRRMGTNKLLLPFGGRTVLGQVVSILRDSPLDAIMIVTGHERDKMEAALGAPGLRFAHNPDYANGDMFSSIQAGLAALPPEFDAALIALGDQPRIQKQVIARVVAAHTPGRVVIPSFERRGGHPILVDRACWPAILALPPSASLRDALRAHSDWPRYVAVDTDTILGDMDTPEDYQQALAAPRP